MQKENAKQKTGKIKVPKGKSIAVNFGFDLDAVCVWYSFGNTSQAACARGEFGPEVGVPRVLDILDKYGIKATFFIPGHTADTFPHACREIVKRGHEVGFHGYAHERVTELNAEEEKKVFDKALEALSRLGVRPTSYRSPAGDYSPDTLRYLEEYGFKCDATFLANDVYPFRPRFYEVHLDGPDVIGPPSSKIVTIPFSWYLDDFIPMEFNINQIPYIVAMRPVSELYDRWISTFDYAVDNCPGAVFALTLHPQTTGRAHTIQLFEKVVRYVLGRNAWVATMDEIVDAYVEDE